MMTHPVPATIDGACVVCASPIDERHTFTGNTRQIVSGELMGVMSGLAICQYPGSDSFYLFGCDGDWSCITDTFHQTFEAALRQAEVEYAGVSSTWIYLRTLTK